MKKIELNGRTILVTGAAGFIGANVVRALLEKTTHSNIVGVDNLNDYYEVALKRYRLSLIGDCAGNSQSRWTFLREDISNKEAVQRIFEQYNPTVVVNLAAQAGVRYSLQNPDSYINSNIVGFYHILEACRHSYGREKRGVQHLVYASSSSVYGGNRKFPFSEEDFVDCPVSLYAATKKSNELLAHSYSKLYNIPCTGLRFFTVYGPAGRPDMAYFSFTGKLLKGEKIQIFNYGNCERDFTYINDMMSGSKHRKHDLWFLHMHLENLIFHSRLAIYCSLHLRTYGCPWFIFMPTLDSRHNYLCPFENQRAF